MYSFVARNEWLVRGCIIAKNLIKSATITYISYFDLESGDEIHNWNEYLDARSIMILCFKLLLSTTCLQVSNVPPIEVHPPDSRSLWFKFPKFRSFRDTFGPKSFCNTHVIQNMRCKRQLQIWLWVPQKRDNISRLYIFRKLEKGQRAKGERPPGSWIGGQGPLGGHIRATTDFHVQIFGQWRYFDIHMKLLKYIIFDKVIVSSCRASGFLARLYMWRSPDDIFRVDSSTLDRETTLLIMMWMYDIVSRRTWVSHLANRSATETMALIFTFLLKGRRQKSHFFRNRS